MNIKNLKRMVKHLKNNVKPENFDMENFDGSDSDLLEEQLNMTACGSIGCIVGHCLILDKENILKNYLVCNGINYNKWSKDFTNIKDRFKWKFLFGANWAFDMDESPIDNKIQLTQAIKRLELVIRLGNFPNNWNEMLEQKTQL